jgi:hypothetical protein
MNEYERLANLMTGKRCRVRFQVPASRQAAATVTKSGGVFCIDIASEPDTPEALWLYFHEVWHVKYEGEQIRNSVLPHLKPGTIPQKAYTAAELPQEDKASKYADEWMEYLERKLPGGSNAEKIKFLIEKIQKMGKRLGIYIDTILL